MTRSSQAIEPPSDPERCKAKLRCAATRRNSDALRRPRGAAQRIVASIGWKQILNVLEMPPGSPSTSLLRCAYAAELLPMTFSHE